VSHCKTKKGKYSGKEGWGAKALAHLECAAGGDLKIETENLDALPQGDLVLERGLDGAQGGGGDEGESSKKYSSGTKRRKSKE